jgi:uncharacterized repeat protein (TIGR01451 family)
LPPGATVLFAGLYFGGRLAAGSGGAPAPNPGAAGTVLFRAPGDAGYRTLTAAAPVDTASQTYQGFIDVTSEVAGAGAGVYRVANVQAGTGRSDGQLAGWSLVVAYGDPASPRRNLSVFDGLQNVASSSSGVSIPLSGFTTPRSGPVNSTVGMVAYEGDLGTDGDGATILGASGPTRLSNAVNPANNVFNSTISANGAIVTKRLPNDVNTLGFDADLFSLPGVLANNQTSTEVRLSTNGDAYQAGVVTIATDLFAPRIEATKTVDADTADLGNVLTYTTTLRNAGEDAATNVVLSDPIPAHTTYVPGSLTVNGVAQSDAVGDDVGEASGGSVRVRVGDGATATAGGRLAPDSATTTVTFQVRIDATAPPETVISNAARISFNAETTGESDEVQTAPAATRVRTPAVDLKVFKLVSSVPSEPFGYQPRPPDTIGFIVTVFNDGTLPAPDVVLSDVLPAPLQLVSIRAPAGSCAGTTCTLGTLRPGRSVEIDIAAGLPSDASLFPPKATLTNTATATTSAIDTNPTNNSASATIDTAPVTDVSVHKSFAPAEPLAGGQVTYTIVVASKGPSVADVFFDDILPPQLQNPQISIAGGTGECSIGEQPDLPGVPQGLCTIPQLEVGGTRTVTLTGTLASDSAGASVTNVAAATPDGLEDSSTRSDDTDQVTFTPHRVDLAFTKTRLDSGPVPVGGETTFRLSATNTGDGTAGGVVLRDELPVGLEALGPPAGCAVSGQLISCSVGSLGPGASASFDVRARAEPSAAGQTLTNRGEAITASPDLDPSNNAAQVPVPIGPAPSPPRSAPLRRRSRDPRARPPRVRPRG